MFYCATKKKINRTAISKWESGRGYPSIDSLKEISNYFSVSIDDLLSGEKLLLIAEKENKSNIRTICDLLFGMVDVSSFMLILLSLYPNTVDEFVYSVNLLAYAETTSFNRLIYWVLFVSLIMVGVVKIIERVEDEFYVRIEHDMTKQQSYCLYNSPTLNEHNI